MAVVGPRRLCRGALLAVNGSREINVVGEQICMHGARTMQACHVSLGISDTSWVVDNSPPTNNVVL